MTFKPPWAIIFGMLLGLVSGLLAAAIWGGMYVVSKVVLDVIPPFILLTSRLVLGAVVLVPFVLRNGGIRFSRQQWGSVLGAGLVGYGISLGFQFVGTKLSTAANGALVTSATPAFVLIFAAWILAERITAQKVAALGLATLGVVIVLDPRSARLLPELFWGNISLVLAALTWALYSVLVRKVTRDLAVLPVSVVLFLGGLPITIPAGLLEYRTIGMGEINFAVLLGVLYIGVISTGLAMYLWNYAFARLDAGVAALTFFAQPVVGAGFGALFLHEKITPLFLVGGVMIGLGLILAAQRSRKAPAET